MTFLRAENHLSYSLTALHFTAWSIGVLFAGSIGEKVMRKFTKPRTVWTAGSGVCGGILIFLAGTNPFITIFGTFMTGLSGSLMCQTLATIMADKFAEARIIAIAEANLTASIFCSIAPFLISVCMKSGINWRVAMVLPVVIFLVFFFSSRHLVPAEASSEPGSRPFAGTLPRFYWFCWTLVFFSVACEWAIIYWGADFLEKVAHISKADAAANLSFYLGAMVLGRLMGSRLVRQFSTKLLLRLACVIAMTGFAIFWLGNSVLLNVIGLSIAGLGLANFYPLTLSAAIGSAPKNAGLATSRMSLASGGATMTSPLLLGLIAEQSNIFTAYGLVAGLLSVCCLIVFTFPPQSSEAV